MTTGQCTATRSGNTWPAESSTTELTVSSLITSQNETSRPWPMPVRSIEISTNRQRCAPRKHNFQCGVELNVPSVQCLLEELSKGTRLFSCVTSEIEADRSRLMHHPAWINHHMAKCIPMLGLATGSFVIGKPVDDHSCPCTKFPANAEGPSGLMTSRVQSSVEFSSVWTTPEQSMMDQTPPDQNGPSSVRP